MMKDTTLRFIMGFVFLYSCIIVVPARAQEIPSGRLIKQVVLWVETSNIKNAGTDADIYLSICWIQNGRGKGLIYDLPDLPGDDNEKGETELYAFEILDNIQLRDIAAILLINGMDGDAPGWHVKRVKMAVRDSAGQQWLIINSNINTWLDTKEPNGPVEPLPIEVKSTKEDFSFSFSSKIKLRGH